MGTRHLIAVMIDEEYKIAQYGQWDGYPDGQGLSVLNFLRSEDMESFKGMVRKTKFMPKEEIEGLGETWKIRFPQLARDIGSDILNMVNRGVVSLADNISFAGDSVFCEWAYVVDFDKNTFEVYQGFNEDPITEGRFCTGDKSLEVQEGYSPIKLARTYQLDDLPSDETFISDLTEEDEE